ncbi:MAG TPA: hypothetical protein VGU43_00615 [Thermoplasmata archaeon]|nr:hypothetical protein [Thermoplasmata archaeon]
MNPKVHIWPNHVRVRELDLVLPRSPGESVATTLDRLARLGLPSTHAVVRLHGGLRAE